MPAATVASPWGALIGPLITGPLQTHPGSHYGFGAAAVGMALGLAQYVVPAKPGCARPHYAKPIATRNFAYGVIGMGLKFLRFLPTSGTTGKAVPVLLVIGAVAVFAGVVVFAIAPWISRLMEGVH